jgi:hypothetical protein
MTYLTSKHDDKTLELSDGCLTLRESKDAQDKLFSAADYIETYYDLSPDEYETEAELAEAMRESGRSSPVREYSDETTDNEETTNDE